MKKWKKWKKRFNEAMHLVRDQRDLIVDLNRENDKLRSALKRIPGLVERAMAWRHLPMSKDVPERTAIQEHIDSSLLTKIKKINEEEKNN